MKKKSLAMTWTGSRKEEKAEAKAQKAKEKEVAAKKEAVTINAIGVVGMAIMGTTVRQPRKVQRRR